MGDSMDVTALVLAAAPVGEYDRRIELLTRERGRIACFARGARRPGSPYMASTLPFCFGTYRLRPGRSSNVLVEARVQSFFEKMRSDMETACYASYFAEVMRYVTRENNDESALLLLAIQSLRALESEKIPNRLVRVVFEIRTVMAEGEFLPPRPGDGFSASALQALDHIAKSPVKTLYTFAVTEPVLRELEHIAAVSMRRAVGRRFESLEILKALVS